MLRNNRLYSIKLTLSHRKTIYIPVSSHAEGERRINYCKSKYQEGATWAIFYLRIRHIFPLIVMYREKFIAENKFLFKKLLYRLSNRIMFDSKELRWGISVHMYVHRILKYRGKALLYNLRSMFYSDDSHSMCSQVRLNREGMRDSRELH